jgi:hypothetical protein
MKITREHLKNIVREAMIEESEYQEFFKRALEKAGKSIPSMSDEEKKAFFNKIEKTWKGRGAKKEQVSELTDAQKKLPPALQKAIEKKDGKKKDESVNEGYSTEEKRIVMMAVKKIAKYMNRDLKTALGYVIGAAKELERSGKIK